jgi:hypothetical protein
MEYPRQNGETRRVFAGSQNPESGSEIDRLWRTGEKWSMVSAERGQRATGASRVDLGLDLRVECFG